MGQINERYQGTETGCRLRMSQDIQLVLASLLGDREVIAYRPALARALGSPIAALYLGQATYWQSKVGIEEWWFKLRDADRDSSGAMIPPTNRTRQSWEWELGMKRSDQEHARQLLKEAGLLEERRAGVPARLYYRVNLLALERFLLGATQMVESHHLDGGIPPSGRREPAGKMDEIPPANSESISETIKNITTTTTIAPPARTTSPTPVDARPNSSSGSDLIFEASIDHMKEQLLRITSSPSLDPQLAQQLLDELAGVLEAGKRGERTPIGAPIGWFRQLVKKALAGEFDRNYCDRIASRRNKAAQVVDQSGNQPEATEEQKHLASLARQEVKDIVNTWRRKQA
ncbi:hypothetical protein [Duganella radicis]|uniref:Uncharacterized protein n=1 Tax=Duganella radicis TaxID=551988 RepID=A0A6L6PPJ6_9BURK|nr:hypothetical protein [Duganella radicis]MTV40832.1 hypothetical protein [Duganella radicis]